MYHEREPTNISAYADPILDELASGELNANGTCFFDTMRQAQGPVLELGRGIGRATIPLAQRGVDITGLELSAPSLAYARAKAGDLPIKWVEADVRSFQLDTRFGLIFARGDVINFMLTRADQDAMLARVREHLDDDGRFMFDDYRPKASERADVLELAAWYTLDHPNGRKIYASGTDRFDLARQIHFETCSERWDDPEGELVRPPWKLALRWFELLELEVLLQDNGFDIVERFGDWDGTPYSEDGYGYAVYACRKGKDL